MKLKRLSVGFGVCAFLSPTYKSSCPKNLPYAVPVYCPLSDTRKNSHLTSMLSSSPPSSTSAISIMSPSKSS